NWLNGQTDQFEAIQKFRFAVPPQSTVPDIAVVKCDRLPQDNGPLNGSPDWLIEICSPGQSTLDLQAKILHCLRHETQLAWLIDFERQQVWVWAGAELPEIFVGEDALPMLEGFPVLTVAQVMAMTGRS
ncbi:MAG: Uma2 family endonuclease, partial [Spirulina sp. SIO3F2]|nr:Uma2 family endonuclease [Spirulina sp. SIO3F2]